MQYNLAFMIYNWNDFGVGICVGYVSALMQDNPLYLQALCTATFAESQHKGVAYTHLS